MALVSEAQLLESERQRLLNVVIGTQVAEVHRALTVRRLGNVLDDFSRFVRQLVDPDEYGRFFRALAVVTQRPVDRLAGLPSVDDLEVPELHPMVGSLQGVVVKSVADDGDAVVVEVEIGGSIRVQKSVADVRVDPIGAPEIATDIALEQLVAVLLEQPMELVDRDPSDEDALEIHVFGNEPAAQSEVGVDVRASLQRPDDGVVVEMQDLDLLAVLLTCLSHPVFGLLGPSAAVVAENEPDSRNVAVENQRADVRNQRCDSLVQRDVAMRIEQHPERTKRVSKVVLRKVCCPAQIPDPVLALKDRDEEVALFDVADVETVHAGVVAAVRQQLDAVFGRQIEGRGHAKHHERGRLAAVLVRPREPLRVLVDHSRHPQIDDAGVDVRRCAPSQCEVKIRGHVQRARQYH